MRFSIEIMRDKADGSSEVVQRTAMEAISPLRVKTAAARELKAWTLRGATRVVIFNAKRDKLYEWGAGEEAA